MQTDVRSTRRTPAAQTGAGEFTSIKNIRAKRITEEISGTLLARKVRIDRTRFSLMENGHLQATDDEIQRLSVALDQLIAAKRQVQELAAAVGWPA